MAAAGFLPKATDIESREVGGEGVSANATLPSSRRHGVAALLDALATGRKA